MADSSYAFVALACVFALYIGWRYQRERMSMKSDFVSKEAREIHKKASDLFASGKTTFGEFKKTIDPITTADAVLYRGCHAAYTGGSLKPEVVQGLLE